MAYSRFRELHNDFLDEEGHPEEGHQPAFLDQDGAPLFEDPELGLLSTVYAQNDVASLHLYNDNPHTKIFQDLSSDAYWLWDYHPFIQAAALNGFDALHALLDIYVADPTLPEPLEQYLAHIPISLMNMACRHANRGMVQRLLHHDPPLGSLHDREDISGETPLYRAAKSMGIESGELVRPLAIRRNSHEKLAETEEFLYFLLDQGCSVQDSDLHVELARTEGSDQLRTERVLYDTVLAAAIPHASYQMVSRLIDEGADIYARLEGWQDHIPISEDGLVTAMHIASIYGNLEGMQALIDHPGDSSAADLVAIVDSAGRTPLHWALRVVQGDLDMDEMSDQDEITAHIVRAVLLLLNANPDTVNMRDNNGATVFHYAVMSYAALESTTLLLSAKPLPHIINVRDYMGDTALKKAIDSHAEGGGTPNKRLMEILQVLLENGADGSGCNNKGHNLVHTLALRFADSDPVELAILDRLLEFVNINSADSYGRTPLHYVARYWSRINFIRRLISQGADVNAVDKKGNTPLHEVMRGQLGKQSGQNTEVDAMTNDLPARARDEVIELLMGAGAAVDHRNAAGKTPPQILDERTNKMKHK
ncbi:uncharacterized protein N7503_005560 [Penicillium pulvis]|uniref:uncharacterized protein n=1 Tax=Penicillium pulvis TaxID=1562058 RepID=UPI002546E6CB|nr:uncharacterized protein N7503_005560 [Penicillium pulvis]KAJ5803110.1 hypothetical protein N7503_005560 [Penicillium pulvis]